MRAGGQITVFLSLILLCVLGLICGLLESARMAGARYYLQTAAVSSLDSVMSQYYRPLWDRYRILGLEYDGEQAIEKEFLRFLMEYVRTDNWYPMEPETVSLKKTVHLTDGGGRYLEEEILEFMKYGIWTRGLDADMALSMKKAVQEGGTVNETSRQLEEQSREAWAVEQILEELRECLEQQERLYQEAKEALEEGNGKAFRKTAQKLTDCLERVPKLVENYGEKAEILGKKIAEVRKNYEKEQDSVSKAVQQAMEQEFHSYDAYTSKDGERRLEVEALAGSAGKQKEVVLAVMETAAEIEEQISSWEPEEGGEQLDEDTLWEPARAAFSEYAILSMNCPAGGEDRESQGLLSQIRRGAESALLEMVLPENAEISEAVLPETGLPSEAEPDKGREEAPYGAGVKGAADKVLYIEYCDQFFGDFCNAGDSGFQYGLEYLLYGNRIDQRNLADSVKQLLAVREGLNLIAILTDPAKRQEAEGLAAAIVGGTGFLPLVGITAFFIMGIWALGEALVDVKTLLSGGNVPIWKNSSAWNLSLEGLLEMGRSGRIVQSEKKEGMDYAGYLKMFLFIAPIKTVDYRMMDLMQTELAEEEPRFRMETCACQVDMEVEVCGKHVFLLPGLLKSTSELGGGAYLYGTEIYKAY